MKKFAVGVYDSFYGTCNVSIVSADSAIDAIWNVYKDYGYYCEGEFKPKEVDDVKDMFPDDVTASDPVEVE